MLKIVSTALAILVTPAYSQLYDYTSTSTVVIANAGPLGADVVHANPFSVSGSITASKGTAFAVESWNLKPDSISFAGNASSNNSTVAVSEFHGTFTFYQWSQLDIAYSTNITSASFLLQISYSSDLDGISRFGEYGRSHWEYSTSPSDSSIILAPGFYTFTASIFADSANGALSSSASYDFNASVYSAVPEPSEYARAIGFLLALLIAYRSRGRNKAEQGAAANP